jgi:hypothetical protein
MAVVMLANVLLSIGREQEEGIYGDLGGVLVGSEQGEPVRREGIRCCCVIGPDGGL